jgi:hypothetical protein
VDESSELNYLQQLPGAARVEIAAGVVMECLHLDPVEPRSYLLGRAQSDARSVDELAGDAIRRRAP